MKKIFFGLMLSLFFIYDSYSQVNDTIHMEVAEEVVYEKTLKTLEDYLDRTDRISGEKSYYSSTPVLSFCRFIKQGISNQYVSIRVEGSTLNYGCYGMSILFENGKKIIRAKEKVDTNFSGGNWVYSAFFRPTPNEINLLRTQRAVYVKLYIYDVDLDISNSDIILEDAKVMLRVPKLKKT